MTTPKELKKRDIVLEIQNEIAAIRQRLMLGNSDNYEQDQKDLDYLLTVQRGFEARVSAEIAKRKNKGKDYAEKYRK